MSQNYSHMSFDDLLRNLRSDPSPTVRMLVLRTDIEIDNINLDHLANLQEIEEDRDAINEKLIAARRSLRELMEAISEGQ